MGDVTGPAPRWIGVIVAVTLAQAVLSLMIRSLPLLGLPLTQAAGMAPEAVGQLAAATSLGSMIFFLWGVGAFPATPAMRLLMGGCVVAGAAMLAAMVASWPLLLLAALVIGLGYGPSAPAGSEILMTAVPKAHRSVVFSVKQAGVPLGGLAAGLLLPVMLMQAGLGAALATSATVAFAAALGLALFLRGVPQAPPRRAAAPQGLAGALAAPLRLFRVLLADPRLRTITVTGLGLGVAQGVLLSYYPVFLSAAAGFTLATAGLAFAVLQGVGIGGRIAMGWLADRIGSATRTLGWLALASAATMVLVGLIGADTPQGVVMAVSGLAGLAVVSWNGVFLSGLAAAAPDGRVAEVTSAGTFVIFAGYVISPLVISAVIRASGSYGLAFALSALPAALGGATLLARGREAE
ncbi:MFS transporter (plasmid) [Paroceanicella profunda]|uniref:MFS transporter n=1 Tax=Paroceanicella profunda TaxID=2579971 RepID=A0A5B8G3M3_9RHOB|nr:MFS transporter [Paroceanicella profunda]QDL93862.1 MFS transporter [Paroceanicella profunda]